MTSNCIPVIHYKLSVTGNLNPVNPIGREAGGKRGVPSRIGLLWPTGAELCISEKKQTQTLKPQTAEQLGRTAG